MLIKELIDELTKIHENEGDIPVFIWHRTGTSCTDIRLYIEKRDLNREDRDETTIVMLDAGDCCL